MQRVGLIGWPVGHSVSPAMHNAAFAELGLNWRYHLLPTEPGRVAEAMAALGESGFRGANVTKPHKQAVIPFLDELSDTARAIGAVNTIVLEDGRWTGHNTDGPGFLAALREAGFAPAGRQALLLGAGGAARAVVHALVGAGCAVVIYNRTAERAAQLAAEFDQAGAHASVHHVPSGTGLADLDLGRFDLLVHATPAGMWPRVGESLWPDVLAMPSRWTVTDLVYNPLETRLLRQARAAGARAIDGLGMLVHQGVLAFELWTGQSPPLAVMRAAAEGSLGHG